MAAELGDGIQRVKECIHKCKCMQYLEVNQSEKICGRGNMTSTLERVGCTTQFKIMRTKHVQPKSQGE